MEPLLAEALLGCVAVYLVIGLAFALVFLTVLIKRFDPGAASAAPVQFRLLIAPGVILLWPILALLLLKRLVRPIGHGDPT